MVQFSGVGSAALLVNPSSYSGTNTSYLIDAQFGNATEWKVDQAGNVSEVGGLTLSGTSPAATTISTLNTNQNLNLTPNGTGAVIVSNTPTNSLLTSALSITPSWSSITGTIDAALLVNPSSYSGTNTSYLIDAQFGSASKWKVDQTGNVTQTGNLTFSGTSLGTGLIVQPPSSTGGYNFILPSTVGGSGQPLLSGGGAPNAMSFGALNLAGGTSIVSGTLPPANGGTGFSNGAVTTMCAGVPGATISGSTAYIGFGTSNATESTVYQPVPVSGTAASMHVQMSASPSVTITFKAKYGTSPTSGTSYLASLSCSINSSSTSCGATNRIPCSSAANCRSGRSSPHARI